MLSVLLSSRLGLMFCGIKERSDYGRGMGAVGGAVSREAIVRQIHPPCGWVRSTT